MKTKKPVFVLAGLNLEQAMHIHLLGDRIREGTYDFAMPEYSLLNIRGNQYRFRKPKIKILFR